MQQVELDTIQELIAQNKADELVALQEQVDLHPADWADFLENLPQEDLARYIELVGPELGLPIFEFISFEAKKAIIEILPTKVLGRLITLMSPDDRADLVEEVDEAMKERILSLLFQAERQNLLNLLSYPENSAGAYMTTEYALLRMDDKVQDGLEQIRLQAPRKENVYYIYVVDTSFHLVGFISLRRLIMARRGEYIQDIMDKRVISVQVDKDIEDVAQQMRHYDFLAMPVVDSQERLVGLITFDDIYDVIQEEATEDMFYLANLDTDETVQSPLFRSVKLRVPWLMFNLITALLVATTVNQFSGTISQYVALAVMMPVVGLLGGNAGNQSLTVVVRALALGEIDLGQHWKVLLKELAVGLCNGLMVGLVIGGIAYFWYQNIWLSLILVIAMTANLVIAGLFGSMVPIILRKMKLDPALGSSIFVTTATDAGGFFIFLGLATLLLHNLLAG
ncbi:MAG: magnesium transporter [Desulfovermiculus sp.]|nr:magnesium transporter [Desulfovermiculus sp.]